MNSLASVGKYDTSMEQAGSVDEKSLHVANHQY